MNDGQNSSGSGTEFTRSALTSRLQSAASSELEQACSSYLTALSSVERELTRLISSKSSQSSTARRPTSPGIVVVTNEQPST